MAAWLACQMEDVEVEADRVAVFCILPAKIRAECESIVQLNEDNTVAELPSLGHITDVHIVNIIQRGDKINCISIVRLLL